MSENLSAPSGIIDRSTNVECGEMGSIVLFQAQTYTLNLDKPFPVSGPQLPHLWGDRVGWICGFYKRCSTEPSGFSIFSPKKEWIYGAKPTLALPPDKDKILVVFISEKKFPAKIHLLNVPRDDYIILKCSSLTQSHDFKWPQGLGRLLTGVG